MGERLRLDSLMSGTRSIAEGDDHKAACGGFRCQPNTIMTYLATFKYWPPPLSAERDGGAGHMGGGAHLGANV